MENIEGLKKLAMGNKDEILKQLKKKGIDPKKLQETFLEEKKKLLKATRANNKTVVLVTPGRQLKQKSVSPQVTQEVATSLLNAKECVGVSCSRLSVGDLSEKTIKIWYDPTVASKNKLASQLVGFDVGGSLLIVCEEGDLKESDIQKLLS